MMSRLFLLLPLLLLVPKSAHAQDGEDAYAFEDDEFVIVGKVQKPEVTVFIARENLNKSYQLDLKESFLPKIVKSVEKAPF